MASGGARLRPGLRETLGRCGAQIIKAIALKRGKRLQSHEAINRYADELSKALGDKSVLIHFGIANSLHQNFYEDWLTLDMVIQYAKIVEKLIKKLKPLAD